VTLEPVEKLLEGGEVLLRQGVQSAFHENDAFFVIEVVSVDLQVRDKEVKGRSVDVVLLQGSDLETCQKRVENQSFLVRVIEVEVGIFAL